MLHRRRIHSLTSPTSSPSSFTSNIEDNTNNNSNVAPSVSSLSSIKVKNNTHQIESNQDNVISKAPNDMVELLNKLNHYKKKVSVLLLIFFNDIIDIQSNNRIIFFIHDSISIIHFNFNIV